VERGDLLEGQAAEGVEEEDLPAGVLQRQGRPAEPGGLLPAEHGILRGRRRVREGQILVGSIREPAPAAALLEPGVFADLAEPGVEAAAALEAVDVQKCLVEGLLKQLLCLVGVAGQGQEEPVDRLALGLIQVFESGHGGSSFPMMP